MSKYYPDVSHWNPVTDWAKAKANCPFLISKATEGTSLIDSTLSAFIKGCEANKIPYWLYAYLRKGSEKAQAEFLVKTCKDKVGDYFVGYILDVEEGNAAENVKAALTYLTGLGYKTMIYHMYADYSKYKSIIADRADTCAWWEARYGTNNGSYNSKYPCHSGVDLHQYTSTGTCPGVSGKSDMNRLTGAKAEAWFASQEAAGTTAAAGADTETTVPASDAPTYKTGTVYTLYVDHLNVRKGAGTDYTKVPYASLTENAKANAYTSGQLKKGTRVTCKATKTVNGDIWMQIPSGWIAAYYKGDVWVK